MASREFVSSLASEDLLPLFESMRKSLSMYFATHNVQYPQIRSTKLSRPCGVFVTYRDQKGSVRGSMGLLDTDRPLVFAAVDSCISAAVDDPRYERIIIDDVADISIEMALIMDIIDITESMNSAREQFFPGMHGLYVEGGVNAGVLLPRDILDSRLQFDAALKRVRVKAGLPASAKGIRYFMLEARTFLQPGHNTQVIELTKRPAPPQARVGQKAQKGWLSMLFTGGKDENN